MAKLAANQERAVQMRSAFVYNQNVLIRFRRPNGKFVREEGSDYTVAPTPEGTKKTLTSFLGKYERKGEIVAYQKPHYEYKDIDIDGDLISDLAEDLTSDKHSRDGLAADLFPLTGKHQKNYAFKLEGIDNYRDREVYRITFTPTRGWEGEDGDMPWAGEVLVDRLEYQPVLITTRLARGFPFWVKTLLGTNVKHLGFKLSYQRVEEGLWFPATYGGEFEVRGQTKRSAILLPRCFGALCP
ncbi:MAG: hypothetical protein HY236_17010 [Acidobacteria bacterium]|nr:hypothetical protein [Acidobacteriota bacterium]